MVFEWDEKKNASNFRKHGVRFEEAALVFDQLPHIFFDEKNSCTEDRFVAIGLWGLKLLVVTFVEDASNCIRIISARKATKQEERRYERGY